MRPDWVLIQLEDVLLQRRGRRDWEFKAPRLMAVSDLITGYSYDVMYFTLLGKREAGRMEKMMIRVGLDIDESYGSDVKYGSVDDFMMMTNNMPGPTIFAGVFVSTLELANKFSKGVHVHDAFSLTEPPE